MNFYEFPFGIGASSSSVDRYSKTKAMRFPGYLWRKALPLLLLSCLLMLVSFRAEAEIRLPGVFSDHAVLQREAPIHVWGAAKPGEPINIALDEDSASDVADGFGFWEVYLPARKAGGPYVLRITGAAGTPAIERRDILVGDVWFASGQSNMEMPLQGFVKSSSPVKGGDKEIASANSPVIRLFLQKRRTAMAPMSDTEDSWAVVTPESAASFSAVGYFFARDIQKHEQAPVGVIQAAWGGTPAHAWLSAEGISWSALNSVGLEAGALARQQSFADEVQSNAANIQAVTGEAPKVMDHKYSWIPSSTFNAMVSPFTKYAIRGWIWYQGEADGGGFRSSSYSRVFPALIQDWRSQWRQGSLPFIFVQLSSYGRGESWGAVRDAQRRALDLVNTGMAVTLDVGQADNVHPPDKRTVGDRLASAAFRVAYGDAKSGLSPSFVRTTVEGSSIRAWFANAERLNSRDQALGDFEIAGADHRFVPAKARIETMAGVATVAAAAEGVSEPKFIRYGWSPVVRSYVYNSSGLPLGAFTSESAEQLVSP